MRLLDTIITCTEIVAFFIYIYSFYIFTTKYIDPAAYMASFAFAGTEPGDLSFNAGDVIMVTEMDGEWWTGTLKGKSGIFPANYVTAHTQKVSN